ncbi:MAG: DUF3604 domain-containing protein [Deltaproteobacteria bacterium]|nr:DUF3604 domain-containing protein [Deltaproteobacteria bacterium]MBW2417999.1 DUF3604 domain-containing protein [Deltaproteobacteria bacterium]
MRPTHLVLAALLAAVLLSCGGSDRQNNEIEGPAHSAEAVAARGRQLAQASRALATKAGVERTLPAKQILFGDLHVHTTYSPDAFTLALPIMGGEGAHTLADACDFARYCSEIDFFSHNDHAEALIPEHWAATKEAVRACNARAGDADDQDLMVFAGWEWTQVGLTPETHWGHKNVIFLGQAEDELPARAINSRPYAAGIGLFAQTRQAAKARFIDPRNWGQYKDLEWLVDRLEEAPECPRDLNSRELPLDCHENAPSPDVLFRKLDEWGFDSLVIPHGTAWGSYTPPLTTWDKSLTGKYFDEEKNRIVEIMSGHGNSEEYRRWRNFYQEGEELVCPAPTPEFLPCCARAGQIARERCGDVSAAECEARVEEAEQIAMRASVSPAFVFPDTQPEDWLDCDQCRDCFKPSFNYRPTMSVQYAMALANEAETGADGRPLRFRFGFIGSTDDHTSRPATGYKQYARKKMTFSPGMMTEMISAREQLPEPADPSRAQALDTNKRMMDAERVTSFTYPGGIVAVHSEARTREAVWGALKQREVYGTSGPKILLWFDLLNGPGGSAPMGSEVSMRQMPRFEVRAAGAFVQKPGCPDSSVNALSPERLEALCAGECDNPSDLRRPIEAIEIVRIRPRTQADEEPGELIDDPWRRFECAPDPAGCSVQFVDPDFPGSGRDVLYYARAIQEPTPAINGNLMRTEFDAEGNAVSVEPCFGDYRTDPEDDCLAPARERAWSSPIFVNQPAMRQARSGP